MAYAVKTGSIVLPQKFFRNLPLLQNGTKAGQRMVPGFNKVLLGNRSYLLSSVIPLVKLVLTAGVLSAEPLDTMPPAMAFT